MQRILLQSLILVKKRKKEQLMPEVCFILFHLFKELIYVRFDIFADSPKTEIIDGTGQVFVK